VLFDLILAIEVGLIAAAILFIVRMSSMFKIDPISLGGAYLEPQFGGEGVAELDLLKRHVVAYRVDGPIFFGASERFIDQLLKVDAEIKVVILRLRRVPVMDASGVTALRALNDRLRRRGVLLLLSGLQQQPTTLLKRTGVYDELTDNGNNDYPTTEGAITAARRHVGNGS